MLAYTYVEHGKFELRDKPRPVLRDARDAIVRVTLASICTSDLHIKHGSVPRAVPGITVGHEMVGIVDEVGEAVTAVRPGDRVTVNVETFCGDCFFCRNGWVNNCTDPEGGWALGCRIDGGQAEYVRVPYADQGLNRIPDGVHVRSGSFHALVYNNASFNAGFDTGGSDKSRIGNYSGGNNRHICSQRFIAGYDLQFSPVLLKCRNSSTGVQLYSAALKFGLRKTSHILIENIENMIRVLDDGYADSFFGKIFGQLQSYKTSADNDGRPYGVILYITLKQDGVFNGAQHEHLVAARSGNIRYKRLSSRRQKQFVIAFSKTYSVSKVAHGHRFILSIDSRYFMPDTHVYTVTVFKAFRRLKRNIVEVLYRAADIIRQSAVGV